jgi:hypothetical protein
MIQRAMRDGVGKRCGRQWKSRARRRRQARNSALVIPTSTQVRRSRTQQERARVEPLGPGCAAKGLLRDDRDVRPKAFSGMTGMCGLDRSAVHLVAQVKHAVALDHHVRILQQVLRVD